MTSPRSNHMASQSFIKALKNNLMLLIKNTSRFWGPLSEVQSADLVFCSERVRKREGAPITNAGS